MLRSWLTVVSLLVTVTLFLAASPRVSRAHATGATQTGPAEGAEADPETIRLKQLYEDAHVAFLAGRYRDAANKFDSGYQSSKLSAFLFNAAVAWEKEGEQSMAVDRYAEYVVRNRNAPDVAAIQTRLEKLKDAVANQRDAALEDVKTKGVTIITTKPEGAELRLDDPDSEVFAITPFRGTLPGGKHTLHITAKGFKPEVQDFPDNQEKMLLAHFSLSEQYFLGHLEIRSPVGGAKVFLRQLKDRDGKPVEQDDQSDAPVGNTPFSNQIQPGVWSLRVSKDGYKGHEQEIEILQGKVKTVSVELQPVEFIEVNFKPKDPASRGAEVAIEGDQGVLCLVPCSTELPPGSHQLVITKKGMKPLRFNISGNKAEAVELTVALQPATRRYPAIVTGVLMAGTAATGIGFGIMAARTKSGIQSDLDQTVQIDKTDPRVNEGKRHAIIADVMFGATALLGALTIYYLVRKTGKPSSGDKQQRSLTLAPAASPVGAGLVGGLQF